jgi:hypothetical protein
MLLIAAGHLRLFRTPPKSQRVMNLGYVRSLSNFA